MNHGWKPTASLLALRQREVLTQAIRHYLHASNSLEVQTPALSRAASTDPYIDSFSSGGSVANQAPCADRLWLHTSPEFPMKRLLCTYKVNLHQLATVFRVDESGRHHNREFTLLEWYRLDFSLLDLIHDAVNLINVCAKALNESAKELHIVSYQTKVKELCGRFPDELSVAEVDAFFSTHNRSFPSSISSPDDALTLLIDEFVVREFSASSITALIDYPASQASLAKTEISPDGQQVAKRAELFIGPVELANGFEELTDADEQLRRFEQDNKVRAGQQKPPMPVDANLIDALRTGLPPCSGMAMGIDRLLMVLAGYPSITDVLTFPEDNA